MKKRLMAFTLAATMMVGSALTVHAANVTDMAGAGAGQEITGSGTIELPEIKITVPTSADIVINPFQMSCTVDSKTYSTQIISPEQEIVNESNVAVAVNIADLTAKDVADGVTISTTELTDKSTAKSAFLYLEVVNEDGTLADKYTRAVNQVVVPYVAAGDTRTKKGAKDAIVTLAAGDSTATKAKFAIGGKVVANPTITDPATKVVSADPWTSTDTFGVSFKFTFTPQVIATP